MVCCIFHSPFFSCAVLHPSTATLLLPSLHSQSGFGRMGERGSMKQRLKHLWRWKEGLKRYLISAHCVTTAYTHTWAHTGKNTLPKNMYVHTHTHTQRHRLKCITPSAFDTFRAIHSLSPKLPLHSPLSCNAHGSKAVFLAYYIGAQRLFL